MINTISLAPEKFVQIVKQMKVSVNAKEVREFLRDVIIEVSKETVTFIGTDGYRMTINKIPFDRGDMYNVYSIPIQEFVDCARNVERWKLERWKKLLIHFEGDTVRLSDGNERQIVFTSNKPLFSPDYYYKALPVPRIASTVIFSPEEVMEFVEEFPKIIREATGKKRLTSLNEFPVELSVLNANKMEVALLIDKSVHIKRKFLYSKLTGEPFSICFNPKFLVEALSLFEWRVALTFNGDRQPVVMRRAEGESFIHVVMPVFFP